jgi:hypothetical protein
MRKEQKEKSGKKKEINWNKGLLVVFGVLFAFLMIGTYMSPLISTFRSVRANDTVTVEYTLRDADGRAILTSNQAIFTQEGQAGSPVFLTQDLAVKAGVIGNDMINAVPAYHPSIGWTEFALLGLEIDDISAEVLDMHSGETKKISFTYEDSLIVNMTPEEYDIIGGNFTRAEVGNYIPIAFSDTPIISAPGENVTQPDPCIRVAKVIQKGTDEIIIQHRYPTVDIAVKDIQ